MTQKFVQIISFHTERADEFVALEEGWKQATLGQRANRREVILQDRDRPTHYVSLNEFDSFEAAMANSSLPATDELATKAAALMLNGGAEFGNFDVLVDTSDGPRVAAALLAGLESGRLPAEVFADDVVLDGNVPFWRFQHRGVAAVEALMGEAYPKGATIESQRTMWTDEGVVIEVALRSTADGTYARNVLLCRVDGGLITRFTMYCTGDWDTATQARHAAEGPMLEA